MMTYKKYCADMKRFKQKPMSEREFNIMQGIGEESHKPLEIKPKRDARSVSASFDNHLKIVSEIKRKRSAPPKKHKAVKEKKPPKPKREPKPPKIKVERVKFTQEEIKERRAERRREKRAELKAQGLTIRGTPRALPKPPKSIEEIRADRLRYAKTWRAKNREKHLAYRKELREKAKNREH